VTAMKTTNDKRDEIQRMAEAAAQERFSGQRLEDLAEGDRRSILMDAAAALEEGVRW
jgi:ABC-type molybdenum transport system ATPase subunit/photorepair protein PhrA